MTSNLERSTLFIQPAPWPLTAENVSVQGSYLLSYRSKELSPWKQGACPTRLPPHPQLLSQPCLQGLHLKLVLLHVSKLVAKLRNRMLDRVEGSWEKLEEEVFLQTTTLSLEARVQEEEEGGEEEGVNPPISMPTPPASTRRGAGEEEGGELLISVIHHPP